MKTFGLFLALALSSSLLSACVSNSTLPEGAKKPQISLQKISLKNDHNGKGGFLVEVKLRHNSKTALPLLMMKNNIFVNNKIASDYTEVMRNVMVPANQDFVVRYFAPANQNSETAAKSLTTSFLTLKLSAAVTAVFSQEEVDKYINPSASFEGLVNNEL